MRTMMPVMRAVTATVFAIGCSKGDSRSNSGEPKAEAVLVRCDASTVRDVVERFGEQLQHVALLAPDSIRSQALRSRYGSFVTPALLDAWITKRQDAPGRPVSSPRPDRIEVDSIVSDGGATCRAFGSVVHVTSADAGGGTREAVTLRLVWRDGWRIDEVDFPNGNGGSVVSSDLGEVMAILGRYYTAIEEKRYREAYEMWSGDGSASGQTFAEFSRQFAETARVRIQPDGPIRVEGAAGSRYATLPVRVMLTRRSGTPQVQQFNGTYVFRRSVVDGATEAQRSWRIHSANLRPVG